jgi:succinate dehydrogenase / fumarate reductase flavoprotein subunit
MELRSRIPSGPIQSKWDTHRFEMKLVNPANKRKFTVIVVGTGLAGGSAAATLSELGYNVLCFSFHDSPRRAHSIAAQGGINAAKNYQNDGDSVYRLFYDTVKGGDFRSREANVYRLAQISVNIIDQCVAQGVPFAREYGGLLANRSFGGAQVSRTFYARGQTGQQLLLGCYQALEKEIARGGVKMFSHTEMLDVVLVDGKARGIITRNLSTGAIEAYAADAVVLATGGYGNAFYLSTNAKNCNATAIWRAHKRGAAFANPCFTQIHPTCIPVSGDYQSKLTLMSESLRNDGRVWVPKTAGDKRRPSEIPEAERDYYLERKYPSFGNLSPRDISSRAAKEVCDEGRGVGETGRGVYLDFADAIRRLGEDKIRERYGNLFEMYERITDEKPVSRADAHLPGRALHHGRALGGLQSHEHAARAARAWRGELLGSWRQSAWCQRADAGARRRVLRDSVHHRRLSGERQTGEGVGRTTGVRGGEGEHRVHDETVVRHQRQTYRRCLPSRARRASVGGLRHGAERGRPAACAQPNSGDP